MAVLTISGQPASRWEELAQGVAHLLGFDLVTESRMEQWMAEEFDRTPVPDSAWASRRRLDPGTDGYGTSSGSRHSRRGIPFPRTARTLRVGIVAPGPLRAGKSDDRAQARPARSRKAPRRNGCDRSEASQASIREGDRIFRRLRPDTERRVSGCRADRRGVTRHPGCPERPRTGFSAAG